MNNRLFLMSLCFMLSIFFRSVYYTRYLKLNKTIYWPSALHNKELNYPLSAIDNLFSIFPFVWIWLDILAAVVSIPIHTSFLVIASLWIAGRFRGLQELTHIGMHQGLCRSRKLAMKQANFFFQYPLFKPDLHYRRKSHYRHHFTNYDHNDPNMQDFMAIGLVPGISQKKFLYCLCYPLMPLGILNTLHKAYKNFLNNRSRKDFYIRVFVCTLTLILLYQVSGTPGIIWGYLFPAWVLYPLLAWIAQVVEHRWFVPQSHIVDRPSYEYENGRVTDYPGIFGQFVRCFIFPFGDSYHLAHSLYMNAHWILLKQIDRQLKKTNPNYLVHRSERLFFSNPHTPSALSELKDRLVGGLQEVNYE